MNPSLLIAIGVIGGLLALIDALLRLRRKRGPRGLVILEAIVAV